MNINSIKGDLQSTEVAHNSWLLSVNWITPHTIKRARHAVD